jgi:DNA gyrase subunit A
VGLRLDYAMSVIVGRALPDVRDGLKPVHRRILYAMHELNNDGTGRTRSRARVGDVIGKYHPHGDTSVYDALVRMAQDFSMRVPLVDGQGNFGSVDGDPPAAMRYTEAASRALADGAAGDIDKETVDFGPTTTARSGAAVLPARFPNLLVNGAGGIAVGMATNIPPHNLGEVIDACRCADRRPATTTTTCWRSCRGPTSRPAGSSRPRRHPPGLRRAAARSSCARAPPSSPSAGDREQIVVTEIPYQVNKANAAREDRRARAREAPRGHLRPARRERPRGHAHGHRAEARRRELRDHQPRHRRGAARWCSRCKAMLQVFIDHRRDVVTRRTRFELRAGRGPARARARPRHGHHGDRPGHPTIRESPGHRHGPRALMALPLRGLEEFVRRAGRPEDEIAEAAKAAGDYRLTERQAKAILDMRLARLTGLEREKLAAEYGELSNTIARLRVHPRRRAGADERDPGRAHRGAARYADPRRTEIVADEGRSPSKTSSRGSTTWW